MKNIIGMLMALTLAACSVGPEKKDAAATYDLGASPAAAANQPRIKASVLVHAVAAPSWLESNFIVYRLNYHDGARQLTYANSRWAAAPGCRAGPTGAASAPPSRCGLALDRLGLRKRDRAHLHAAGA